MSPTWSACRWERKTLVIDSTGSSSDEKLASTPDPRSKKKIAGLMPVMQLSLGLPG